jgi:hypothetical protein
MPNGSFWMAKRYGVLEEVPAKEKHALILEGGKS